MLLETKKREEEKRRRRKNQKKDKQRKRTRSSVFLEVLNTIPCPRAGISAMRWSWPGLTPATEDVGRVMGAPRVNYE